MIALTKLSENSIQITLGWTPVQGCIGYAFYADDTRVSNTWDPSVSQVTFAKGAAEYRVQAVGGLDEGVYVPPVAPNVPGNFRVTGKTDKTITVAWDAVTGAVSYKPAITPAGGATQYFTTTALTHTFSGLAANTSYEVDVQAKTGAGDGPWAGRIPVTTDQTQQPPAGSGILGLVPNGGFPSTGNGGTLAQSLRPKEIREDHLSAALVSWAAANNAKVIGLATGKDTAATMALLNTYPSIKIWELDNEPYFAGVNLANWSRMMRDTAKAIKAKDASIEVLVPVNATVNGGDYQTGGAWSPWVTQMLTAAPDLPQYVDSWAVHPYSSPRDDPPQFALMEKVKGQLEARNAMRPFSVTEVGWSVGTATGSMGQTTLAEQGQFVGQFIDQSRTRQWIRRIVIYSLRSWGSGFEESFGLFNPDGSERPAAAAFRSRV